MFHRRGLYDLRAHTTIVAFMFSHRERSCESSWPFSLVLKPSKGIFWSHGLFPHLEPGCRARLSLSFFLLTGLCLPFLLPSLFLFLSYRLFVIFPPLSFRPLFHLFAFPFRSISLVTCSWCHVGAFWPASYHSDIQMEPQPGPRHTDNWLRDLIERHR